MRRKIPSSAALLAFEAAARHGNFARAAAELALTEGAISRQIARLEALLDSKLFDRTGSRVRLNPAGARYARQVREILARLERDTHDVSGMPVDGRSLEIAVLPTFASRWLIPRLGRFAAQHPHIVVNIAARSDPFILPGSGFDAAIHFEHPAWTGMEVTFLFAEYLLPVCHAALLTDDDLPGLLNRLTRIHRRQNPDAWLHYARECGLALDNPAQGPRYDLHEMAIAAVLSQQGVALVPKMYVESELSAGTLVAPWPGSPTLAKRFCLIKPGGGRGSQRCRCLSAGCRRRLRQVKSELAGRHLAPPMVSSLLYRALAFLHQGIVISMEYCCCEATASALRPDSFLLSHDKILSVYLFYSVYRLFQHYAVTPDLNRDSAEFKLNILRQYADTNGIFLCMYC